MSDNPEWITDKRMTRFLLTKPHVTLPAPPVEDNFKERRNAIRAVGFLEGMSSWLWTQVGPNLDDEIAAEYDKRVADIAAYIGLPPREVDAE